MKGVMPIGPSHLIFLANELQHPRWHRELNLPLEFVAFGITQGRMYHHFRNKGVFILPPDVKRPHGNRVVYGSIYILHDFDYYIRILDAYHMCSLSSLHRNHDFDTHHRVISDITPIHFDTLDELERLLYRESELVKAHTYFGNLKHPKIKQRLKSKKHSNRIYDGVCKQSFLEQYWEVQT